ncbi:MAG: hypothetical protein EBU33_03120, partial [Sphingobacteriia bacterium]|nr:hypothetical protein [Sphingobacteriia bacterium]
LVRQMISGDRISATQPIVQDRPTVGPFKTKDGWIWLSGNFQNLYFFRNLLFPLWRPLAFSFWSHKVLRWFTPFLLLILLIVSLSLAVHFPLFFVLAALQIIGLMLPVLNHYFKFRTESLRFISHFYLMNAALLAGFFRYTKGIQSSVWQPVKRNV